MFTGDVLDVEGLADIPLDGDDVLTLVPYRQVRERGFAAKDDGAPLRNLVVRERESVPLAEVLRLLPEREIPVEERGFDVPDDEYADIVRRVIEDEIGRGEGANFVINRAFVAQQINDRLNPIITQVMQQRGATLAVYTAATLAVSPSIDVTNAVLAALNAALPSVNVNAPSAPAPAQPAGR